MINLVKIIDEIFKDRLDEKLHKDHVEGSFRQECWAKVNLLDTIIAKAKKEL